jgi:hypothetical protein
MFKIFTFIVLMGTSLALNADIEYQSSLKIEKRAGEEASTFAFWQQIINDAGLYGSNSDAQSAKQIYESLDLDTLQEVVKFYNHPDFLPYQKGLVRLNQIIYRINTHAYPAN